MVSLKDTTVDVMHLFTNASSETLCHSFSFGCAKPIPGYPFLRMRRSPVHILNLLKQAVDVG